MAPGLAFFFFGRDVAAVFFEFVFFTAIALLNRRNYVRKKISHTIAISTITAIVLITRTFRTEGPGSAWRASRVVSTICSPRFSTIATSPAHWIDLPSKANAAHRSWFL
ncbi:hypothetical protein X566_15680 [Afipia sp. P52-10]|nr:hypothetical protein X566_15680 [Afipia sp. P52-10]